MNTKEIADAILMKCGYDRDFVNTISIEGNHVILNFNTNKFQLDIVVSGNTSYLTGMAPQILEEEAIIFQRNTRAMYKLPMRSMRYYEVLAMFIVVNHRNFVVVGMYKKSRPTKILYYGMIAL